MLFLHFLTIFHPLIGATGLSGTATTLGQKGGEAIALGVGAGGGAAGAGAGIGAVFNASIQAKTRQPELRQDIERDQWLGFALTEACFFYGLVGGFIAAFLF
jgi:F-type H+-transporting ATPase subunit c